MDPATGTFTTMDTYGGSLSDPMSLHKYLFANSNPVMYTDPSGHFSLAEMDAAMAIDIMLDSSYISGFLYIVDASITDPELEHHDIMGYFGAVGFGFIFSGLSLMLSSFVTGALVLAIINTVFASMGVAKGIQDFENGHVVYGPLEAVVSVVGCAIGWNNFTNVWCAQQTSELISVKGRGTGSDDAYIDYVGKEIDAWYESEYSYSGNKSLVGSRFPEDPNQLFPENYAGLTKNVKSNGNIDYIVEAGGKTYKIEYHFIYCKPFFFPAHVFTSPFLFI